MSEPRKIVWYLFCCDDAHSNETVASTLDGLQSASDFQKHECTDGKQRHLYVVPDYNFASRMIKSQAQLKAKFQIFCAQDGGKPTAWKFDKKQKPSMKKIRGRSDTIKKKATAHRQR